MQNESTRTSAGPRDANARRRRVAIDRLPTDDAAHARRATAARGNRKHAAAVVNERITGIMCGSKPPRKIGLCWRTMTPDEAVRRLAAFVTEKGEFSADEVYNAMEKAGVPEATADRAYKFAQIAWTHLCLADSGLKFPSEYFCLNGGGEIVETGLLAQEPSYAAAIVVGKENARTPGISRLVSMSAEVNSINAALHKGSKPENLVLGPPAIFLEDPTAEGLEKAREEIRRRLPPAAPRKSPRPWWRFWA